MSSLSDLVLPVGAVLLGAYLVSRVFSGGDSCQASSQTCIGSLCWATCQATGGSTQTQPKAGQAGADIYGTPYLSYPWGSLNIGLPAAPGNTPGACGPLDWVTRWRECGFSW